MKLIHIIISVVGILVLIGASYWAGRMGRTIDPDFAASLPDSGGASVALNSESVRPTESSRHSQLYDERAEISKQVAGLKGIASSPHQKALLQAMLREWALREPSAALAYVQANYPNEQELLLAVYEGWAEGDPIGAWAKAREAGSLVIEAVLGVVGETSPQNLEPFLGELDVTLNFDDPDPLGPIFVEGIRSMVGHGLTKEAVEVSAKVQEPEFRRNAFKSIALGMLEHDSEEEEVTQVILSFPNEADRVTASGAVARLMADETPSGAMAWAETLPKGAPSRKEALYQSATKWGEDDFYAATDWISDHVDDPDLDQAVVHVALHEKMIDVSPEISMEWVESIHDKSVRFESMVQVAGMWGLEDPGKALQSIANSKVLSADEKVLARKQVQELMSAP